MFQNRCDAGLQLAEKLKIYKSEHPIILALAKGGVPIGYKVAQTLKAPLDVLVVQKVGAPWNPELGVGAVGPGVQILDKASLHTLGISTSEIEERIKKKQEEVKKRQKLYQSKPLPDVAGKTVILVDDGVATGITTRAAIQIIKQLNPQKLILAIPVGPEDTIKVLTQLVDELVCLKSPASFYAVGAFYFSFPQVSDAEVVRLLKRAQKAREN